MQQMFTNWHPIESWILTVLQSELSKVLEQPVRQVILAEIEFATALD